MAVNLTGRHFLSMKDIDRAECLAILDRADQYRRNRAALQRSAPLAGRTLAMLFQKPSLRTRVSFETGMTLMGGHAIYLGPEQSKIGERESTEDFALVLSRYASLIMARVFGHDIVTDLAKYSSVPVINGLSDFEHPCQILADLQTIRARKKRLEGLTLAFIGDGNNVAHSLMYGGALVGMNVTIACPRGYVPADIVLRESQAMAAKAGATVKIVHDPLEGAHGADVLYTDVWASMGQESEAAKRKEDFRGYQINDELLRAANDGAIILHCLPAHYGEEIDYATSRTPNSAIFDQAENRLHAQNALMTYLAGIGGRAPASGARRFSAKAAKAKPAARVKRAKAPKAAKPSKRRGGR